MQMTVLYEFRLAKYYMHLSRHSYLNNLPEAREMQKNILFTMKGQLDPNTNIFP